jgi:Na+/H+-dicarboxylate symporter
MNTSIKKEIASLLVIFGIIIGVFTTCILFYSEFSEIIVNLNTGFINFIKRLFLPLIVGFITSLIFIIPAILLNKQENKNEK